MIKTYWEMNPPFRKGLTCTLKDGARVELVEILDSERKVYLGEVIVPGPDGSYDYRRVVESDVVERSL
jgi:hypothetical protein